MAPCPTVYAAAPALTARPPSTSVAIAMQSPVGGLPVLAATNVMDCCLATELALAGVLGVSYVGDDVQQRPRYERLLMIGTAFMLHPHQAHVFDQEYQEKMSVLSESERRYSSLGWTDAVQSFPSAVRSKNVIELAPYISEGEAVSVCVPAASA